MIATPSITHCRLCSVVCSSRMSVSSDTLSSVVSMMMMASASERTSRLPYLRSPVGSAADREGAGPPGSPADRGLAG